MLLCCAGYYWGGGYYCTSTELAVVVMVPKQMSCPRKPYVPSAAATAVYEEVVRYAAAVCFRFRGSAEVVPAVVPHHLPKRYKHREPPYTAVVSGGLSGVAKTR